MSVSLKLGRSDPRVNTAKLQSERCWGQTLTQRIGARKVAVARKLVLHRMWRDNTEFRWEPAR